jgi:hypothetical protein
MQPNPVSDVKAPCANVCIRTRNVMAAVALGSWLFWMGAKPERYVIQMRDSKSSRNGVGQPRSRARPSPFAASLRSDSSRLVRIQLSSSVPGVRSTLGGGEAASGVLEAALGVGFGGVCFCLEVYWRPRHQTGASESLVGSGS